MLLDLAAPGAGFAAASLDELLGAFEVALHAAVHHTQQIAELFDRTDWLVVDLDIETAGVVVDVMKGDDAGVAVASRAMPGDAVIGVLLGNLGVPLLMLPGDGRDPVQALVIELTHFLDALHEHGELFELRPLIVSGSDRDVHINRLVGLCHSWRSFRCVQSRRSRHPGCTSPAIEPEFRSHAYRRLDVACG